MRLDKWLADAGVGTRSEVKNYIRKKQVLVNDLPVTDPGFQVTEQDSICYQSRQIGQKGNVYYMFHKPAGCVSATEDAGRTVLDYFPEAERKHLILCGRLDKDTEGFLIVTNDGAFSHRLMSPRHHVDKTYYFEAEGLLAEDAKKQVLLGIDIGDEKPTLPAQLTVLKADQGKQTICGTIILQEGRYHQVKRMLLKLGVKVTYLKRTAIGSVLLDPSLAKGTYRALTKEEMKKLTGEDNNE